MKKLILILLLLSMKISFAAEDPTLEAGLVKALKQKPGTTERLGDSGAALRAYIAAGYLDLKPSQRADYTDYRLLKKPAMLMGHTLVLIEEEYMTRHIGCCVSPGVGVTVRLSGSSKNLEKFAEKNGCSFNPKADPQEELKLYGIKANLPIGKYASISCRERDAQNARADAGAP